MDERRMFVSFWPILGRFICAPHTSTQYSNFNKLNELLLLHKIKSYNKNRELS